MIFKFSYVIPSSAYRITLHFSLYHKNTMLKSNSLHSLQTVSKHTENITEVCHVHDLQTKGEN